ncbi:TetR/AcrR family transcriptional regulator [Cellulomonas xylanilytica]|uniref:TetR family transcriptional regulator n=1 Tax=Cellulomonas xylanilytica TaxID=233583 RepID=A0A510V454_9CELL|nr:TetR/AcrR family transcriptional regulator [Cellulomonas xylanilytica]GEK20681.1 TetR family transcriptional regulator [Cellulomonas xylanilytica]
MARPRVHDDALRARLLEEASAVVATAGAVALTVRDLAVRAGTSPSAVYSLFGSREDLVRAVGDEAFARFAQRLATVPRTADPAADLLGLGLAYRENALADPHFYRVMFGAVGAGLQDGTRGPATASATFLVLRDAVARVLGDETTAQEPALGLWALVHGLVELELDGLLPDGADQRYVQVLRAAGQGILDG